MREAKRRAYLALADGLFFEGYSLGARGERTGEVIFNTSLMGYQEILTDPSYRGQLVVMTYPLCGNYGINEEDLESCRPWVEGFIVKEASPYPSNWRSRESLDAFLKRNEIVGIQGIDTRTLTRHIRDRGAQMGILSTEDSDPQSLVARVRSVPDLIGRDLAKEVTCPQAYRWKEGVWQLGQGYSPPPQGEGGQPGTYRVVAYDFGIKRNILRQLVDVGCQVTVVPAAATAEKVLALEPDGIFLSNGPGDPEGVHYAIENIRKLLGKKPIFGICLGHQLLALAMGGRTYKLKFGHHGGNQPVMDLSTGRVEITAQNHGFAVDVESLSGQARLTHINLNDRTVEGMEHCELPIFSVQYHPEASPGPHDASYLFDRFVQLMKE
ncbi:MAG: glutamine-hydrolyzing carbamoyl-phosphate synthase small subunit [Candidatus Tectomicrobia bacterium]|uniref:Carbamoyl phosphate synthase small chain n=1 Tax=Tectimicrobiota bacterium TaxID=2528274 RepID=A0A932FZP6_UNCTE|nr:glutamine-hydrolyzing carbamoyl-phosphate synthase small subunit [Candidatus Tectomicrobia bacterium]